MLSLERRIQAFHKLGEYINTQLMDENSDWLNRITTSAFQKNGWFEPREVRNALSYWAEHLNQERLTSWINTSISEQPASGFAVGLVLAGNIPMVGFHDIVSVVLSGHRAVIKPSSNDDIIIPALIACAIDIEPDLQHHLHIVSRLENFDAVIATGSNNSTRYFEQYFGGVPHIIRGNRTGAAILTGEESEDELHGLMKDCFQYFGLGCRNVTKLYLPKGYELNRIFKASLPFAYLMDNKKYTNNYTYHKALMMMEQKHVLENELILMIEEPSLFSPVSVLNYEYYNSATDLNNKMEENLDSIQCIIGKDHRDFGTAQEPALSDYADGINTLEFLSKLHVKQLTN